MSHGRGKSDRGVVPKKLPNKAAGEVPAAAEVVEGRLRAKGNALAARMSRRSSRVYDVGTALEGIRQTARGRRDAKFAGLLHHIYAVERLKAAYHALRRDAAPGVDGQTWQSYGQDLEANLLDLSDRLARGGYRPEPVKRAYIDKADGSKRPLGVPALEDQVGRLWHRTLCRRSQTKHLSWKRMYKIVDHWLPRPHICHPYPNQRLIVTTRGKSRVR